MKAAIVLFLHLSALVSACGAAAPDAGTFEVPDVEVASGDQPNGGGSSFGGQIEGRAGSSNALLGELTLSSGKLDRQFAANTKTYSVTVENTTKALLLIATAREMHAEIQMRVNDDAFVVVASGKPSPWLGLEIGDNTIEITVTAQNGAEATYTIAAHRAASADATLSALSLSIGSLSPSFKASITDYTVDVDDATETITIDAKAAHPAARIVLPSESSSVAFFVGSASHEIELKHGENEFNVVVLAEDGLTMTTYTLTVTRGESGAPSVADEDLTDADIATIYARQAASF